MYEILTWIMDEVLWLSSGLTEFDCHFHETGLCHLAKDIAVIYWGSIDYISIFFSPGTMHTILYFHTADLVIFTQI